MLCHWDIHCPPAMPIFFFFLLLLLLVPCSAELSFNFTSFNPNNHEIRYHGNASSSDSVIQLTINQKDKEMTTSAGRATYERPFQLWDSTSGAIADFTTHFCFIINSQSSHLYADGLAFFLASQDFQLSDFQEGRGLGLVGGEEQVINSTRSNRFVAVEFDTFNNSWDPPCDHVGIDINSMISVKNVTWFSRIPSGQMNEAWISYNSSSKNLSVVFTGFIGENETIQQSLFHVVDLREHLPDWVSFGFSAATGKLFEIHTLHSWEFSSNFQIKGRRTKKRSGVLLGGTIVGGCVLIIGLGLLCFCFWKKKKKKKKIDREKKEDCDDFKISYEFEGETGPKKFSYKELAAATKNFIEEEKLGQGGFGGVYRGFLRNLNSYIAVKRVSKGFKQGIKEYASEVKIISRLRHRNLVQLIGWCHEERELLLAYEFMPNGSLDSHLFKENSFLAWPKRYDIARGLAAALLYLHEEWEQCVLHRDIKSSNIMLDSNFNAKLGDFGLARLVDHGKDSETTVLAGTMGYMAPEYLTTGRASKESDVYGFGVVALEIACARKPINPIAEDGRIGVVDWAWELYGTGKVLEAADAKLGGDFNNQEMECLLIVGLWCAHPDHNLRPSMKQAIQVLNFEAPLPILPSTMPLPTYSAVAPLQTPAGSLTSSYLLTGSDEGNLV